MSFGSVFDIVLNAPDQTCAEILPLLQVHTDQDIGHRILESIVKPRGPPRQVSDRRNVKSCFRAYQALRSEVFVGERPNGSHAKTSIEFVQRGRPKPPTGPAPNRQIVR